jgi:hypothetical protein
VPSKAKPFRLLQVEYASRSIPDSLYRWQLITNGHGSKDGVVLPDDDEVCPTTTSSLNGREQDVLLGFMNGLSAEEIVALLAPHEVVTTDAVYQSHKSARTKLSGADESPLGLIGALTPRTF